MQFGAGRQGWSSFRANHLERCNQLANELGGWIVWLDESTQPAKPSGPYFVPMEEWLSMFERNGGIGK